MILTHKLTLSLDQRGERPCVDAVQGDTARALEVSLMENGVAWAIPEGCTGVVSYRRIRGGAGGIYEALSDGTPACTMAENRLTVQLAPQVLAAAGPVELQVMLLQGEKALSSFAILIHVQGNLSDATEDVESYVNLQDQIRQIVESMELSSPGDPVFYVVADSDSVSGVWTGKCPQITHYYDGLMIAYRTAATGGANNTTLNINGLGAATIKRNGINYDVNYFYTAGAVLNLTYVTVDGVGYWQMTDMWFTDTDKKTSATQAYSKKLYLLGSQAISSAGLTSYVNPSCYVGADNCLYSGGQKVVTENAIPDEVPEYVRTEADRVAKLVQSRQNGNTITMLLGSDLHARVDGADSGQNLEGIRHGAQAMKIIRDRVHIDMAAMLGDYICDDGETVEQAMQMHRMIHEFFAPAFSGLPQFWCKGNHDGLGEGSSSDAALTWAQIYSAIGIHNSGAVFNLQEREKGYCYRDFADYKLRIICMNTNESYNTLMNLAQYNWLRTALDVAEGWKTILLSHIPLDWVSQTATMYQPVLEFQDKILCNLHGHLHNFLTGTLQGTTIPRVAIPNMCFSRNNEYGTNGALEGSDGTKEFGEAVTRGKTAGTAEDTAFCVVTIDLASKKLYADHYGAGIDREVDLQDTGSGDEGGDTGDDEGSESGYTNRIPLSTSTFDGTEIYNGIGYQSGRRIGSGEGFPESDATGMCVTGFIPVKEGDVLRVKNVTLTAPQTPYLVRYNILGGPQQTESVSVLGTADANGVYTYVVPYNTGAVRLSVGLIDDSSIVTVNEPIE